MARLAPVAGLGEGDHPHPNPPPSKGEGFNEGSEKKERLLLVYFSHPLGSPRPLVAIMLRWISEVPAPMVAETQSR